MNEVITNSNSDNNDVMEDDSFRYVVPRYLVSRYVVSRYVV